MHSAFRLPVLALFSAIALGAAYSMTSPALAAKVCKPVVTTGHSAIMPTKDLAEQQVRNAWTLKATKKHTLKFANWANAVDKKIPCEMKTNNVGLNGIRCSASAKPCALE